MIFFLWGYVKDDVFVPPLPRDLAQLRERITHTVASIDRQMLGRVWQELHYRIDVCRSPTVETVRGQVEISRDTLSTDTSVSAGKDFRIALYRATPSIYSRIKDS